MRPATQALFIPYALTEDHLGKFERIQGASYRRQRGRWCPVVGQPMRKFPERGDGHRGFARPAYHGCRHQAILAHSCKYRLSCPLPTEAHPLFRRAARHAHTRTGRSRRWVVTIPKLLRPCSRSALITSASSANGLPSPRADLPGGRRRPLCLPRRCPIRPELPRRSRSPSPRPRYCRPAPMVCLRGRRRLPGRHRRQGTPRLLPRPHPGPSGIAPHTSPHTVAHDFRRDRSRTPDPTTIFLPAEPEAGCRAGSAEDGTAGPAARSHRKGQATAAVCRAAAGQGRKSSFSPLFGLRACPSPITAVKNGGIRPRRGMISEDSRADRAVPSRPPEKANYDPSPLAPVVWFSSSRTRDCSPIQVVV